MSKAANSDGGSASDPPPTSLSAGAGAAPASVVAAAFGRSGSLASDEQEEVIDPTKLVHIDGDESEESDLEDGQDEPEIEEDADNNTGDDEEKKAADLLEIQRAIYHGQLGGMQKSMSQRASTYADDFYERITSSFAAQAQLYRIGVLGKNIMSIGDKQKPMGTSMELNSRIDTVVINNIGNYLATPSKGERDRSAGHLVRGKRGDCTNDKTPHKTHHPQPP